MSAPFSRPKPHTQSPRQTSALTTLPRHPPTLHHPMTVTRRLDPRAHGRTATGGPTVGSPVKPANDSGRRLSRQGP